jgi:hypothetical protein
MGNALQYVVLGHGRIAKAMAAAGPFRKCCDQNESDLAAGRDRQAVPSGERDQLRETVRVAEPVDPSGRVRDIVPV